MCKKHNYGSMSIVVVPSLIESYQNNYVIIIWGFWSVFQYHQAILMDTDWCPTIELNADIIYLKIASDLID